MDLEQRDIGRVDAGNTACLAEVIPGLDLLELDARFGLEARHNIEVDPIGDGAAFIGAVPFDVGLFAAEVAFVLDLGFELGGDLGVDLLERRREIGPEDGRALEQMRPRLAVLLGGLEAWISRGIGERGPA